MIINKCLLITSFHDIQHKYVSWRKVQRQTHISYVHWLLLLCFDILSFSANFRVKVKIP